MAGNVIRQDIVQIKFDVAKSPLGNIAKEANALKDSVNGIKTDGLTKIAQTAKQSTSAVDSLKRNIQRRVFSKQKISL
jgi:hypothetical protein